MNQYQKIDALFQEGFALNQKNDMVGCCDKWLEAWELIKELYAEGVAESVADLDNKYKWSQWPTNIVQFLEMELLNAGIEDKTYHHKRVIYCQELLQWSGTDELLINNTRIALGEAYYMSGDASSGEQVFKEWIQEDPDCGWAYSGWAGCCHFNSNGISYEKAEEILLAGYARSGLRDSGYVVEGLINLYEDLGKPDKAKEFKRINSELQRAEAVKIGRNDPCPCGSGKKYKKCCGA